MEDLYSKRNVSNNSIAGDMILITTCNKSLDISDEGGLAPPVIMSANDQSAMGRTVRRAMSGNYVCGWVCGCAC